MVNTLVSTRSISRKSSSDSRKTETSTSASAACPEQRTNDCRTSGRRCAKKRDRNRPTHPRPVGDRRIQNYYPVPRWPDSVLLVQGLPSDRGGTAAVAGCRLLPRHGRIAHRGGDRPHG